jgi:hypothetical protein
VTSSGRLQSVFSNPLRLGKRNHGPVLAGAAATNAAAAAGVPHETPIPRYLPVEIPTYRASLREEFREFSQGGNRSGILGQERRAEDRRADHSQGRELAGRLHLAPLLPPRPICDSRFQASLSWAGPRSRSSSEPSRVRGPRKACLSPRRGSRRTPESIPPKNETKVALIDGKDPAELMIDYDVGVSPVVNFELKKIDSDYFED